MNPSLQTRTPVNKQAAMIIQKAPWWAYYNEPAKQAPKLFPDHEWETNADLFCAPPKTNGDCKQTDKRGRRVEFSNGEFGVVTGFQFQTARTGFGNGKLKRWWVICEDGGIRTIKTGGGKSSKWKFIK